MNHIKWRLGLLSLLSAVAVLLLVFGLIPVPRASVVAHTGTSGSLRGLVERWEYHASQGHASPGLSLHETICPLYAGATPVRSSDDTATLVTGDAFGQVLKWYEGQHHEKAELEAAPNGRGVPHAIASYSMVTSFAFFGDRSLGHAWKHASETIRRPQSRANVPEVRLEGTSEGTLVVR